VEDLKEASKLRVREVERNAVLRDPRQAWPITGN